MTSIDKLTFEGTWEEIEGLTGKTFPGKNKRDSVKYALVYGKLYINNEYYELKNHNID